MMLAPGMVPVQQLLAAACIVLLAIGYAVVGALWLWPRSRPAAQEIFPILLTETLIVGVVAAAFWLDGAVLTLLLLAHALRTGYEAARVTLPRAGITGAAPALALGLGIVLTAGLAALLPFWWIIAAAVLLALGTGLYRGLRPRGLAGLLLELALFPGLPLVVFTAAALQGNAPLLLIAFLLVETFDSYALLGGKLLGRRRIFPVLSPRKTAEGLAVGALMLALTAALAGPLLLDLSVLHSVLAALCAGGFTIAGDLAASRLKRAAGVKDFPRVLRHQGGLLDITDAWIATGAGLVLLSALT